MYMDEIIAIALKGGAAEKLELARSFYTGIDDIPKNTEQAIFWFKEAAKVGSIDAMLFLGHGFVAGEISEKEQVKWLKLAAKKGSDKALFFLGDRYYNGGQTSDTNLRRSFYYFHRAAREGNSFAEFALFEIYRNGYLVKKDLKKAMFWLTRSYEKDNPEAIIQYNIIKGLS